MSPTGSLRNITKLKPWKLYNVLVEKYEWDPEEAKGFTEFLQPMLDYNPLLRATAAKSGEHPWLDSVKNYHHHHHHHLQKEQNSPTPAPNITTSTSPKTKTVEIKFV